MGAPSSATSPPRQGRWVNFPATLPRGWGVRRPCMLGRTGAVASSGAGAAEALEGEYDCGKEGRKADGVGDEGEIDVEVDGGVGEEEGDGTEDVGEVGGDEEGAGEDDDDEDHHTGSSCRGKRSETMRKRRRKRRRKRGDYGLVIWRN
ncbi:hypothetical protein CRG98_017268 [Punica granatum]|uniref:Uncharacterized protein n=1 Tax=Punica granatum TaxID=22663 RepID=A0A2I0K1B5_PUNGR|nr:hypothetical protein CRG98_017268 [Punica granatum]